MSTTRLLASCLRAMGRYKLRSGFMALGTLVGVTALTVVIAVAQAVERKMLTTIRQLFGASSVIVATGPGTLVGGPRSEGTRLTLEDVEAVARQLPAIEAWDPQQALTGAAIRRGEASTTALVFGRSERFERVWNRGVSRGEPFDLAAVTAASRVALLGETVARKLFGTEDPVGAEIQIGGVPFKVIGLLEAFGTDAHGMDRDAEIVVPISTAMRRLLNVDTLGAAKLVVRDPAQVEATAGEVRRILRERHGLTAGQADDFRTLTTVQVQQMVAKVERVLFVFLPLVAAVTLLAAAAVSASLMLASVNSRVGEIGLRRAVGARADDVRLQFLVETAATTVTGGLGGVTMGILLAQFAARQMHLGDVVAWKAALLGLVASLVVGLAAGLLPARRAARLAPADALR